MLSERVESKTGSYHITSKKPRWHAVRKTAAVGGSSAGGAVVKRGHIMRKVRDDEIPPKAIKPIMLIPSQPIMNPPIPPAPCSRRMERCYHFNQCHLRFGCEPAALGEKIYESLGRISHG